MLCIFKYSAIFENVILIPCCDSPNDVLNVFKTMAFRERSPGLLPILKLFSRTGLRISVLGNRERFQVTRWSTSWCEHKWHNLIHYVRRWKPEKLRCGRVPSVAPKKLASSEFSVLAGRAREEAWCLVRWSRCCFYWHGVPNGFTCDGFHWFWSGGLLGTMFLKGFGKMFWERGICGNRDFDSRMV